MLAGCGTLTEPLRTPPPANLMKSCPPLPGLQEEAHMGTMMLWMDATRIQYIDCADRHSTLARACSL